MTLSINLPVILFLSGCPWARSAIARVRVGCSLEGGATDTEANKAEHAGLPACGAQLLKSRRSPSAVFMNTLFSIRFGGTVEF